MKIFDAAKGVRKTRSSVGIVNVGHSQRGTGERPLTMADREYKVWLWTKMRTSLRVRNLLRSLQGRPASGPHGDILLAASNWLCSTKSLRRDFPMPESRNWMTLFGDPAFQTNDYVADGNYSIAAPVTAQEQPEPKPRRERPVINARGADDTTILAPWKAAVLRRIR